MRPRLTNNVKLLVVEAPFTCEIGWAKKVQGPSGKSKNLSAEGWHGAYVCKDEEGG